MSVKMENGLSTKENGLSTNVKENGLPAKVKEENGLPAKENGLPAKVKEENGLSGVVITKEMEEQEQALMEAGEKKEKERMEKARAAMEKDTQDMRFKRLQHLLEKSNVYSKFLLTKMELQQQEEKRRQERLDKKNKKSKDEGKEVTTEKVTRRKRGRDEDYKIADVISKEEIMSKSKKAKVEEDDEELTLSMNLDVDDIEKIGDSNDAIKGRLSEVVRENSKQMLDEERKVDGQPVFIQQPVLLTGGVMRWYQIEGIEWLRMMWENGINGILADEMGLGKTIQCIAHIAMMVDRKVTGPFLVVAPLSTLPNWIREFARFAPQVSVELYHGLPEERVAKLKKVRRPQGELKMHPVVVTSFEIAMRDRVQLQRLQWKFLIVDEGHRIKNMNCRLVRELKLLPADNKLLLTGTPLQNNLSELWSLLNFLLPEVFDDLKSFESWFDIDTISSDADNIVANEREQGILSMLHQILTPFLLRRLKTDVTLDVPPKKEVVVYAPLTAKQASLYTACVQKTIASDLGMERCPSKVMKVEGKRKRRKVNYNEMDEDEDLDQSEEALQKYLEKLRENTEALTFHSSFTPVEDEKPKDVIINLKLANILMLLKKSCNHPYLIEYPLDAGTQQFKIDEELVKSSGKFLILDRMLPELKRRGHKVLIFSTMTTILDLLQDYCWLRDYEYSRLDGGMKFEERDENMHKFNTDPEVFLFLLSTRAGGLGINLTAADTVIIFDSDWNPQADLQAQDRCHRIGQTKPVVVYRLVTGNTIDQKIVEKASAKRKLEKMVIHKNKFKGGKAELNKKSMFEINELVELLKGRDTEKELKSTKGKVISDKDLEFLLDRSDLMDKDKKTTQEKGGVFRVMEVAENDILLS